MKRTITLLLAFCMVVALAACENKSSTETALPAKSTGQTSAPETTPAPETEGDHVLIACFSATGNTAEAAGYLAEALGADLYEITPEEPYTADDLNWNDENSRCTQEHNDPSLRPAIRGGVENMEEYNVVLLGYPIWWGDAPLIVRTFLESYDFSGKIIIPFCTSSSSGFGDSGKNLQEFAPNADWRDGIRFSSNPDQSDVTEWANSLGLKVSGKPGQEDPEGRSLVVCFSMPETTDPNNMTKDEDNSVVVIDGEVLGNTQYMAYVIQKTAGADIFRIEPETPYSTDHDTLVDQAAEEQDRDARPAIKGTVDNIADYDVVFIGYPNWWGDMPMILYSFFDEYDLSGKTIIPFNTHGGSGFSNTINTIRQLEPDAVVLDGLSISRNAIQDAEQDIVDWVQGLDLAE